MTSSTNINDLTPKSNATEFTDGIPPGLARLQRLIWDGEQWVGVTIFTAVTLAPQMNEWFDCFDKDDEGCEHPDEVEVPRTETFCIHVKPYYAGRLSEGKRFRLCAQKVLHVIAALRGKMSHRLVRGESVFEPEADQPPSEQAGISVAMQ